MDTPNFQTIFDNLLSQLKKSNKVVEVSSHFGPRKELSEMFAYLWKLEEVHDCIKFGPIIISKDEEKAENLRKDGNKYYQKKMLRKALECYNKSIIYSQQYDVNEIINSSCPSDVFKSVYLVSPEKSKAKNLSYGYANRSAVLLELKNYEKSLHDISRAICQGYPPILKPKLVERQAKCYIAQGNMKKAKEVLTNCISDLKNCGLDEKKIENTQKSLELLLTECSSLEENSNINGKEDNTEHEDFVTDVPSLLEVNREIPSLSSSLSLSYSQRNGRFLMANQDIMPGEVLIKEKSFGHIILPQYLHFHCSNCVKRISTPIPCPFCSNVVFCSEECLCKAMNLFHHIECPILSMLLALDLGNNAILAFRLVTQTRLSELKVKIPDYEKTQSDPLRLGFNEEGIYSSSDYRTIYHLVTNQEMRTVSDLFKRAIMAVCMVKLLLLTDFFGHAVRDVSEINNCELLEDVILIGKIFFNHLMNLPCNAHSLTELQVNTAKYQESYIEEVGAGAFGVFSLTNHSCNPSLARCCYGNIVVARAIQFIPKGTEVFDSYGEHYAIHGRDHRQNYLMQQYYFSCLCRACMENWPTYNALSKEISLKCSYCSHLIISGASKCEKCKKLISEMAASIPDKDNANMNDVFIEIRSALTKYNAAYAKVLKGDITEETYQCIINLVFWISKYASFPSKLLFEAQETLKHCLDRKALHFCIEK